MPKNDELKSNLPDGFKDEEIEAIMDLGEEIQNLVAKHVEDGMDESVALEGALLGAALVAAGFDMSTEDKLESFKGSIEQAADMVSENDEEEGDDE